MPEESRNKFWTRWWRRPGNAFPRLVEHFLARLVSGGQDANGEFELGAGALLGLLAAPGAFTETSSYVYGVGAYLLAGSEIYKAAK